MSLTIKHLFDRPLAVLAAATDVSGYQGGCMVENRIADSIAQRCNSRRSLAKGAIPSHLLNRTPFMARWNEQSDLFDDVQEQICSSLNVTFTRCCDCRRAFSTLKA
jgi:hypothetical protein